MDTHKINKYLFKLNTVNKNSDQYKKYLFKLKQHGGAAWSKNETDRFIIMYILANPTSLQTIKIHRGGEQNATINNYVSDITSALKQLLKQLLNTQDEKEKNITLGNTSEKHIREDIHGLFQDIALAGVSLVYLYKILNHTDIAGVLGDKIQSNRAHAVPIMEKQKERQKILQNPPPSPDEFLTGLSQQHIIAQHKEFLPPK